jgi:2-polyprenyl-3-methyl-5-hydroxy-6-metoxy-1,4-benzoquinol methylase
MSALAVKKTETQDSTSYEELPYETLTYPQTHPAHLAMIAGLHGMKPPDFRTARVLEIGCGLGGNLLPQALVYPKAQFLGIDLSAGHIKEAEAQKAALGLSNIEFRQQDIMEFDLAANGEAFDYIICHGVLSWVPEPVAQKIFEVCAATLSPRGLAVVSYNTLPGWNAMHSVREMMQHHTRNLSTPREKVAAMRALIDFLAARVAPDNAAHRVLIDQMLNKARTATDSYLYHDYLEADNRQFYFHQFMDTARRHGLAYVSDASLPSLCFGNSGLETLPLSDDPRDIETQEQYQDYITNRRFRSSVLCRIGQRVDRAGMKERVGDFLIGALGGWTASAPDPIKGPTFRHSNGIAFNVPNPEAAALCLEILDCEQEPVAAGELIRRVQKRLNLAQSAPVRKALNELGLNMAVSGFMCMYSDSPACVREVAEKPVVFPYARLQAARPMLSVVTNVFGTTIQNTGVDKMILPHLDGTKTAADLADLLTEDFRKNVETGAVKVEGGTEGLPGKLPSIRQGLLPVIQESLRKMAKNALLVG